MWLVAAAALNVALAEEPRRVGPETGDHPVYRPQTEILWPDQEVTGFLVRPTGCIFPPRPYGFLGAVIRTDFRKELDASARLAVPVDRVAP